MSDAIRQDYLRELYLKTNGDVTVYTSHRMLMKLLGIDQRVGNGILSYWVDKKSVKTQPGYGDDTYGDAVALSAYGIDQVEKMKAGKIFRRFKFVSAVHLQPTGRDVEGFFFRYNVVKEDLSVEPKTIQVVVSDVVEMNWNLSFHSMLKDSEKILLQYAKDKVTEKLKEGTLNKEEKLELYSHSVPDICPYDPKDLIEIEDAEYEVEIAVKPLVEEIAENNLAASIIEIRDTLNALFNEKYKKGKLLLLNQERNLLDFFKSARSEEDFSHRLASLAEVARNLNKAVLFEISGKGDLSDGSVRHLENFLISISKPNLNIIGTLRHIGRMRNGYPAHTDYPDVIKSYRYFGFDYPIEDFETAWTTLLTRYLAALEELHNNI